MPPALRSWAAQCRRGLEADRQFQSPERPGPVPSTGTSSARTAASSVRAGRRLVAFLNQGRVRRYAEWKPTFQQRPTKPQRPSAFRADALPAERMADSCDCVVDSGRSPRSASSNLIEMVNQSGYHLHYTKLNGIRSDVLFAFGIRPIRKSQLRGSAMEVARPATFPSRTVGTSRSGRTSMRFAWLQRPSSRAMRDCSRRARAQSTCSRFEAPWCAAPILRVQ